MSATVKIPKHLEAEVSLFLSQRQSYGMRLKGLLMMRNLQGLAELVGEIHQITLKMGITPLAELSKQIEASAQKGDMNACMALVGEYEQRADHLAVEFV